tara:strand:- start:4010 stop:5245 length:1236 start_codon:yes stop_codon:yes gene_type:complete
MMKKLLTNIFNLTFVNFFSYIFPLIQTPLIISRVGIESYSSIVEGLAFMLLGYSISNFAADIKGVELISRSRKRKKILSFYLSNYTTIKFALSVCYSVLLFILVLFRKEHGFESTDFVLICFILPILSQSISVQWVARGLEKFLLISVVTVFTRMLNFIFIMLFINNKADLWVYPVTLFFTQFIGILVIMLMINVKLYFHYITMDNIKKIVIKVFPYYKSRLALSSFNAFPVIILGWYESKAALALYGVVDQYYRAAKILYNSISVASFPFFARTRDIKTFRKLLNINFLLLILVFLSAFVLYPYVADIINVNDAVENFGFLYFTFLFIFIVSVTSSLLGYPLFSIFDRTSVVNKSIDIAMMIFIILSLILMILGKVNIFSITVTVLLSECSMLAIRIYYYNKVKVLNCVD